MYKKILVPLDGSEHAETILPYARALARTYHAGVVLLHAIDPEATQMLTMYAGVERDQIERSSREYFETLRPSFDGAKSVEIEIREGHPASVIVSRAQGHRRTLIAMSTHGRTGLRRWYLGNIAHKVLYGAKNPLLLIRGGARGSSSGRARVRRIVVPLDGSSYAERALEHARDIAESTGAELRLLRVVGGITSAFAPVSKSKLTTLVARARRDAKTYLTGCTQKLTEVGFDGRVTAAVLDGDIAGEIAQEAKAARNSIVVLSSHGGSGGHHRFLSSTTDRVVHDSHRATLIVQTPPRRGKRRAS